MANARVDLTELLQGVKRISGTAIKVVGSQVFVRTSKGVVRSLAGSIVVSVGDAVYIEDGNVIGLSAGLSNVQVYQI